MLKYSLATALTSLADTQTKQLQPLTKLMLVNCPCASKIQKKLYIRIETCLWCRRKGPTVPISIKRSEDFDKAFTLTTMFLCRHAECSAHLRAQAGKSAGHVSPIPAS